MEEVKYSDYYNELKQDPNLLSHWFPAIKECGIHVPETEVIPVPEHVTQAFFMDNMDKDRETVYNWVNEAVMPVVTNFPYHFNTPLLFMKNGCFSNKFDARNCFVNRDAHEITHKLISINYDALCFGAGGITDLVFRQFIPHVTEKTPCIYHGLPLRPEFRVFYNFDEHRVLYSVNYWDWDYCHDAISRDATDRIVYEDIYPEISRQFDCRHKDVEDMVQEHLQSVTVLSGRWSVDILLDESDTYWLIDMAIAEQSAYWNQNSSISTL